MSPLHPHPPASLRYLKARLWNLARPSFWGTAIFLSVIGLVIRQYWTNPSFFFMVRTQNPENTKPLESFLSEEEKAIAADIDNLPVLFYDSRQQNLSATVSKPKKKTQVDQEQVSLENLVKQRNNLQNQDGFYSGTTKQQSFSPKIENPFLQQANKLLELNNFGSSKQFLQINPANKTSSGSLISTSFLNSGILNSTQSNSLQNPTPTNALQKALNQLESKNQQQQQTLSQSSLQNNIASPIVPSKESANFNPNINNPGLPINTSTPISAIGQLQSPYNNPTPPPRFVNNYDRLNIQTNTQINTQTNIRNLPPNSYNTYVSAPQPVNVNPTRQLNAPVSSGVTNNITSNNSKFHSLQTPRQTVITPNNSVVPNNYNPNLQPYYQQPTTVTNYNYSTPGQVPQKINGYSYP